MAKIFLVLTIILTLGAAFLGYQTSNKLDTVKAAIEKGKTDVKDATAKLQKANDDLKGAKAQAAASDEKAATATAEATKDKADLDTANASVADQKTKIDGLTTDLDKAKKDLADALANGNGKTPVTPVAGEAEKTITDLKAQLLEAQTLSTTLQTKVKDDDDKIADLTKKVTGIQTQKAKTGLEGEVMAVNQGWNFVVVSIGDRQGATANAQLIVKRGDTMIGKVKITSVEPSTSIADIIPDSVPKGQRVMPGDRVIFPVQ